MPLEDLNVICPLYIFGISIFNSSKIYFRGIIPGSVQLVSIKNKIVITSIMAHNIGITIWCNQIDGAITAKKIALTMRRQHHTHKLRGISLIGPVIKLPQQKKRLFAGHTWKSWGIFGVFFFYILTILLYDLIYNPLMRYVIFFVLHF